MAEENMTEAQESEQQQAETDWQAKYEEMRNHMREWEKKAKANQGAADELEKLKAEQMTEQEKEKARADKAEAELASYKAEAERVEAARQIANETGVPFDLLMYCNDIEAMNDFAKKYQTEQPHAVAVSNRPNIIRGEGKKTNGDIFADAVAGLF